MIYCLAHKKVSYGLPENVLQVGADYFERIDEAVAYDNENDNIGSWNPFYAEVTGIYWIWKNCKAKVKGQFQYRRRLKLSGVDIDNVLKSNDVITCNPLELGSTVEMQYASYHNFNDLLEVEGIVETMYPEYTESIDRYWRNGKRLYYSNGFIMKSKDYNVYCRWLFSILEEYRRRRGFETVEDVKGYVESNLYRYNPNARLEIPYQAQLAGFLSERLFTLYILHNFKAICSVGYKRMEDTRI